MQQGEQGEAFARQQAIGGITEERQAERGQQQQHEQRQQDAMFYGDSQRNAPAPRFTPSPDGKGGTSALSLNKPFLFQVSGRHLFGVLAFHSDLRVEFCSVGPSSEANTGFSSSGRLACAFSAASRTIGAGA